jgi:hypothetical protein
MRAVGSQAILGKIGVVFQVVVQLRHGEKIRIEHRTRNAPRGLGPSINRDITRHFAFQNIPLPSASKYFLIFLIYLFSAREQQQ